MLKKLLIGTILVSSVTACNDLQNLETEPATSSSFLCSRSHPCPEKKDAYVYGALDRQTQSDDTDDKADAPPSVEEVTEEQEEAFDNTPVEKIKGLGIEGRRLSPDVAIAASVGEYKKTGSAKPIIGDNVVTYPFGVGEPKVVCIPQHACMVEFQAGEKISNVVIGDSESWDAQLINAGEGHNSRDMVVLKAVYGSGARTNMMVTTDKRIYNIALQSVNRGQYTPRVNFYYPQDTVLYQRKQQAENDRIKALQTPTFAASIADLNFEYDLDDTDGKPWAPVRVFDDGRKVYIQMKKSMDVTEAPVLFEKSKKGDLSIVNYRVQGDYYIVDKLFKTAVLKLGEDDSEVVTIARKG